MEQTALEQLRADLRQLKNKIAQAMLEVVEAQLPKTGWWADNDMYGKVGIVEFKKEHQFKFEFFGNQKTALGVAAQNKRTFAYFLDDDQGDYVLDFADMDITLDDRIKFIDAIEKLSA